MSKKFAWNNQKIRVLIREYKKGTSTKKIARMIGCKGLKTPIKKLEELGLWKRIRLTKEDEDFILSNFGKKTSLEVGKLIGKSPSAITNIWRKNGLKSDIFKWTDNKVNILRELYPYEDEDIILKKLHSSNFNNIRNKAIKLGIKRDRKYKKDELIGMLKNMAEKLGHTPSVFELEGVSVNPFVKNFGTYSKACEQAGLSPNMSDRNGNVLSVIYSKNGDRCFSLSEVFITNFFIDNKIPYKKEVFYKELSDDKRFGDMVLDWLVKEKIIVEYFGLKDKEYIKKSNLKVFLCKENKLKIISLYYKDLSIKKLKDIFC